MPGGGYFYARHYLLGLLCAAIEAFMLVFFAVSLRDAIEGLSGSIVYAVYTGTIYLAIKTIALIHSTEFTAEYIPATARMDERPR